MCQAIIRCRHMNLDRRLTFLMNFYHRGLSPITTGYCSVHKITLTSINLAFFFFFGWGDCTRLTAGKGCEANAEVSMSAFNREHFLNERGDTKTIKLQKIFMILLQIRLPTCTSTFINKYPLYSFLFYHPKAACTLSYFHATKPALRL